MRHRARRQPEPHATAGRARAPGRARAVVVGVDGGPGGWDALSWAAIEATATARPLIVVHAVPWPPVADAFAPPPMDQADAVRDAGVLVVAEAVRRVRAAAPVPDLLTRLEADPRPGAAILRAGHDAALIVLGRSGERRPTLFHLRERVAAHVTRRSCCPVVIVGASRNAFPRGPVRRALDGRGSLAPVFLVSSPSAGPCGCADAG